MDNKNNVDRFSGFADCYDKYRPAPPKIIAEILTKYIGEKPSLVVDLGCGTGLSTFLWNGLSDKIIGIDPNEDMINKAIDKLGNNKEDSNIAFQLGYGNSTNVESNSADIITCSSSFQWMEPESTINEVIRILKDDGVYAVYNHDQPNIFDWRLEKAYGDLLYKIYKFLDESTEEEGRGQLWTLKEYMDIMKKTNKFRFMKEIVVHHRVKMDADGFIGFAFSQGALQTLRKKNILWVNEEIQKFIEIVKERLSNDGVDALFSYRIRLAIK